jgi:hypothetical protein
VKAGILETHVLSHDEGVRDVVVVPRDLRLVDQVTAVTSTDRTGRRRAP